MANTNVQEIPITADIQAGVDHQENANAMVKEVAQQLGEPAAELTPLTERKEILDQSNLDAFLNTMGAKEQEAVARQEVEPNNIIRFAQKAEAFNPFSDETDRVNSASDAHQIGEKRKVELGFEEDKKAA